MSRDQNAVQHIHVDLRCREKISSSLSGGKAHENEKAVEEQISPGVLEVLGRDGRARAPSCQA